MMDALKGCGISQHSSQEQCVDLELLENQSNIRARLQAQVVSI